ncbi:MAG: SWIM zinc finger family protein, partial [Deltaproteobacteria bacterium]|nr:SWIM zinc finger family protein [Deltaproteobacteria bacterium]
MFDSRDVQRALGEPDFSRGLEYFERGMVRSAEFETRSRVHGRVAGSRANAYEVWAVLSFGVDDALRSVSGSCTCPVAFNCKHVAALLLAACNAPSRSKARDPVPHEVRRWLDRWSGRNGAAVELRPSGPPAAGQEHLFYVIHRSEMRGMCIDPYRAYLRKDRTIGSNFQRFDRRSSWARRNLTVQDSSLLGRLALFADDSFDPRSEWPEGEVLVDLVREIVETGRARAHDIHGVALSWTPPRRCELFWDVGEAGEQRLAARDGDGSSLTLLPFPAPFFVDSATGEMGVAETEMAPRMASWLAEAPAVPRAAVEAVAGALARMGKHAPVPRLQRVEERTGVAPEPVLVLYGREQKVVLYEPGEYRRGRGRDVSAVYPCARVEVAYAGAERRLRPGEAGEIRADDGPVVIRCDPVKEAGLREAFVQAAKRHGGEDPGALRYEVSPPSGVREADVVFPPLMKGDAQDAVAAGIDFVAQGVPALRAEGWRVEIERTWPFRLHEGPVAFSTSLDPSD